LDEISPRLSSMCALVGLTSLNKLEIWKCEALEEFPPRLRYMCALEFNFLKCWSLKKILEGFGGLRSLKKFDMQECKAVE
jgi:hypothetical protein